MTTIRPGSAYLFDIETGQELIKLTSPAGEDFFGWSAGIDGNTAIVGVAPALTHGTVYVFDVKRPEPQLSGDYNASGTVEQADLDLVLLNWGRTAASPPTGWTNNLPSGSIDQDELDGVLLNWGNTTVATTAVSSLVPEPDNAALLRVALMVGAVVLWGRRSAVGV